MKRMKRIRKSRCVASYFLHPFHPFHPLTALSPWVRTGMFNNHYYTPDSVFWRINREALMVLSVPRALLLEMAHPLVAAGGAEHRHFQGAPPRPVVRRGGGMA